MGAGGHAKAVVGASQTAGYDVVAVYDDDARKWGKTLLGVPIFGPIDRVLDIGRTPVLIGIGDAGTRETLVERLQLDWATVIHPSAFRHLSAVVEPGTVIFAGAVVQPEARIGAHVIVNANATVAHDCILEDYVHLAPGVALAGSVRVGKAAFVGIGAVVINNITIGAGTIVGAGAAVTSDLPKGVIAVGSPARPIKFVDGQMLPAGVLYEEPAT